MNLSASARKATGIRTLCPLGFAVLLSWGCGSEPEPKFQGEAPKVSLEVRGDGFASNLDRLSRELRSAIDHQLTSRHIAEVVPGSGGERLMVEFVEETPGEPAPSSFHVLDPSRTAPEPTAFPARLMQMTVSLQKPDGKPPLNLGAVRSVVSAAWSNGDIEIPIEKLAQIVADKLARQERDKTSSL